MSILAITDNAYFKLGLENLCVSQSFDLKLLVVDLDSFNCLSDILKSIRQQKICDDIKVCFFGGDSVNFRVLNKFKPLKSNNDLHKVRGLISNRKFPALFEIKAFMTDISRMSMFTDRQRQCLYALKFYGEINAASKATGLSKKTMYSIIRSAGDKVHLTTLLHVRQFLSSNYNVLNER